MTTEPFAPIDGIRLALDLVAGQIDRYQRLVVDSGLRDGEEALKTAFYMVMGELKLLILQVDNLAEHVQRIEQSQPRPVSSE